MLFDKSIELKDNAMLKRKPELFSEWNFEKNDKLGLDVYKVTYGSSKKVWWICLKCDSDYDMTVSNKRQQTKSGRRVIAVDPNRIPLGSIVQVTLSNGTSFEATAQDIGGVIKGNIIDVAHSTKAEAYQFGRQSITVRIIKKGN